MPLMAATVRLPRAPGRPGAPGDRRRRHRRSNRGRRDRRDRATCLYAVYDPVSRRLTTASAGAPPSVILEPGGTARVLDVGTARVLDVGTARVLGVGAGPVLGVGGLRSRPRPNCRRAVSSRCSLTVWWRPPLTTRIPVSPGCARCWRPRAPRWRVAVTPCSRRCCRSTPATTWPSSSRVRGRWTPGRSECGTWPPTSRWWPRPAGSPWPNGRHGVHVRRGLIGNAKAAAGGVGTLPAECPPNARRKAPARSRTTSSRLNCSDTGGHR
ncbi:hypothetical protein ABIE67_001199 [Streptomyces sp. V4I8]